MFTVHDNDPHRTKAPKHSPVKSLRYRCLHSEESAVATLKCLQTDDSLKTSLTSSSRRTRRRSSGGRAARPNATGRAIAGNTRQQNLQSAEPTPKLRFQPAGHRTFSGCSDQRVHQLVFEDPGQFLQVFEGCSCTFSCTTDT